jgi:hypothetical protein
MNDDLSKLQFLDVVNRCRMENLTNGEYDILRTLAEKYLTYQTLFQLLSAKLPCKPGVKDAWELLGDCIMCSDEEAEKRRKLENESNLRMRRAEAEHNQRKRQQHEERKQTIAAALGQQLKLQKVVDELQQSMANLQDQLRSLQ